VLALAATGVMPIEAAPHLAGGNEEIATELFMFAAEGLPVANVDACRPAEATDGDQEQCSATVETSYGARAAVELMLTRSWDPAAWVVSEIELRRG
jgi:hypothetical protein